MRMRRLTLAFAAVTAAGASQAAGLSPYLPLNLSPEIEWQVERLLVLADEPVLTRPIRAATVMRALDKGCTSDPALCQRVRRYLARYMNGAGLTHASAEIAAAKDADVTLANARGAKASSNYNGSIAAYFQPTPYAIASVGALAYEDDIQPEGTYLSAGLDVMRVDIGYRPHWLSPMQNSSMLWSTQAPTIPSVTLSNDVPLTSWGFNYEMFVGQLSHSDHIAYQGAYTSGKPSVVGMHLSLRPLEWVSLGFNRSMQFGGGARGGKSVKDIFKAFFDPSGSDNSREDLTTDEEFGNQMASFTVRMTLPEPFPMALYGEYAGEDTSRGQNWRLGNGALSLGVHLPELPGDLDLVYEFNQWQNGWYVHHIYQDGFANDGHVVGHWFGDMGIKGEPGSAHSLRLNQEIYPGHLLTVGLSLIDFEENGNAQYEQGWRVNGRYSRVFSNFLGGVEVALGRTPTDVDYSQFSLFVRW